MDRSEVLFLILVTNSIDLTGILLLMLLSLKRASKPIILVGDTFRCSQSPVVIYLVSPSICISNPVPFLLNEEALTHHVGVVLFYRHDFLVLSSLKG